MSFIGMKNIASLTLFWKKNTDRNPEEKSYGQRLLSFDDSEGQSRLQTTELRVGFEHDHVLVTVLMQNGASTHLKCKPLKSSGHKGAAKELCTILDGHSSRAAEITRLLDSRQDGQRLIITHSSAQLENAV